MKLGWKKKRTLGSWIGEVIMKSAILVLTLGFAAQSAIAAQEDGATNTVKVLLQSCGTVFKGLPAFVAVEVRNEGEQRVEFPECSPVQRGCVPFMLQLATTDGRVLFASPGDVASGFVSSLHSVLATGMLS